jgi:hypothetical protein
MVDLDSLPPPGRRAGEGYYLDPLGGRRARWWDGTRWTHTVGPEVDPATAAGLGKGRPVPAPAKTCPHCGVESETFEGTCPSCGKSYERRKAIRAAVIAAVALLVLVGGCGALIALTDDLDSDSVSEAEYDSVAQGESLTAVETRFGDPADREEFEQSIGGRVVEGECLYYYQEGTDSFDEEYFQFCFDDGTLYLKSEY